jgi:hypothetical protein
MAYTSDARWAAAYWEPAGDEAEFSDGRLSGTGDWQAFLLVVEYPPNLAILEGLNARWQLGSSETPASHWLVVDRPSGAVYLAPLANVHRFLASQWPPPLHWQPTAEEIAAVVERLRQSLANMEPLRAEDFRQEHEAHQARLAALQAALHRN